MGCGSWLCRSVAWKCLVEVSPVVVTVRVRTVYSANSPCNYALCLATICINSGQPARCNL